MCATLIIQLDNSLPAAVRIEKEAIDLRLLSSLPLADIISRVVSLNRLIYLGLPSVDGYADHVLYIGYSTRTRLQVHKPAQANYRVAASRCKTLLRSGIIFNK